MRISSLLLVFAVLGCSTQAPVQSAAVAVEPQAEPASMAEAVDDIPSDAVPTRILDEDATARLLGNSGMTLQWIDWEKRGQLDAGKRDGEIWLSGAQYARDGGVGALYLEGRVVEIGSDYFIFSGKISIEDTPDEGRLCIGRRDNWRFAVTQDRKYWRLREFEWCDALTDYVDIYF